MVHTGMTSLTNLGEMGVIYPFAGFEWLFTLVALGVLVYLVVGQISMENAGIKEEMALVTRPDVPMVPAE